MELKFKDVSLDSYHSIRQYTPRQFDNSLSLYGSQPVTKTLTARPLALRHKDRFELLNSMFKRSWSLRSSTRVARSFQRGINRLGKKGSWQPHYYIGSHEIGLNNLFWSFTLPVDLARTKMIVFYFDNDIGSCLFLYWCSNRLVCAPHSVLDVDA